jgi:hypothetical protein
VVAYRDKKVVGALCVFRAPLHMVLSTCVEKGRRHGEQNFDFHVHVIAAELITTLRDYVRERKHLVYM